MPSKMTLSQIRGEGVRFVLSGAAVTLGGTIILVILLHFISYPFAYTIVFLMSIAANLALHSAFVFRKRLRKSNIWKAVTAQLIIFCLGLIGLGVFVEKLQLGPFFAPVANLLLCTPINFALMRFVFHFKAKDEPVEKY